jgi:hypothetical protein
VILTAAKALEESVDAAPVPALAVSGQSSQAD